DKSPEEDDLATMPAKHIDPHFQPALVETDIPAIAAQHSVSPFPPDKEANIITYDGATGRRDNHQHNRKLVRLPGTDGSNQQHRLTREGNPCAFNSHKDKDRPIAIGNQEMLQGCCSHIKHMM